MYFIGIIALPTSFLVFVFAALAKAPLPAVPDVFAVGVGTMCAVLLSVALVSVWVHRRYALVAGPRYG